jgi:hypothetical protein
MDEILDGDNIPEIIFKFKTIINENIISLLGFHIFNTLNINIITTHLIQFIKSINLFFDGIPNYSKMLEQRRRRMKNYIDSKNRKVIFKKHFKDTILNIITEDSITFDYFEWVTNMYSFDKALGPYSKVLLYLSKFIEIKMNETFKNIKIYVNDSTNYGESDHKIFNHIVNYNIDGDVSIHSCDSDFIFLIVWYQLISVVKYNDINLILINYSNNNNDLNWHFHQLNLILLVIFLFDLIKKY